MGTKRDYVAEIHDRRLRVGSPHHIVMMFDRLQGLLRELEQGKTVSDELMRYFPIATVACIETYTRSMVQELIDAGPPFSDRLDAFEHVKLEMPTMQAIHGRRISLGELVGHLIPVNNLDDVKRALGNLIDADLIDLVRVAKHRWHGRFDENVQEPIVKDIGSVIRGVEWTFRLRHMYAHEFPANRTINRELIAESVTASAMFLQATDEGIRALRFPNEPLTQSEMNRYAHEQLEKADEELRGWTDDFIASLHDDHAKMLREAQEAWLIVRDKTSRLMADLEAEGGSMWRMIYSDNAGRMTRQRLEEIQGVVELTL